MVLGRFAAPGWQHDILALLFSNLNDQGTSKAC
jgi:hypothetical protein